MYRMFFQSGFQNSLATWDVSNVGNLTEVLSGSQLTTVNFDNTLVGWSYLENLQNNVQFDEGKEPETGDTIEINYATWGCE